MKDERGFIETGLYRMIHRMMAIPTVDLVIRNSGKSLLLRREREPDRGKLWLPGGRIRRNESFEQTARRVAKKETALEIRDLQPLNMGSLTFPMDPFNHGEGTHIVSCTFYCTTPLQEAVPDENHRDPVWIGNDEAWKLKDELHPYVFESIMKAAAREETTRRIADATKS